MTILVTGGTGVLGRRVVDQLVVAGHRGLDVRHLVYVPIVGVDRNPIRYYRAKRYVESIVENQSSGGPTWTQHLEAATAHRGVLR